MTEQELLAAKQRIETIVAELRQTVSYLEGVTQVIAPSVSLGRVTRMEAIGEKAVNEHALSLSKQRINRLENVLKRIDSKTYGKCLRCNKDIPFGRLEQVPEALMCVSCAEKKS